MSRFLCTSFASDPDLESEHGLYANFTNVGQSPRVFTRANGPSHRQWERLRPIIAKLYEEDGMMLKEIVAIMEQHYGHIASERMYKFRIHMWGLAKNKRVNDVAFILSKWTRRKSQGKNTIFLLRGKLVNKQALDNCMRRLSENSARKLRSVHDAGSVPSTPPHITYKTPPSTPMLNARAALDNLQGQNPTVHIDDGSLTPNMIETQLIQQNLLQDFQMPTPISPPQEMILSEKLFSSISAYYCSAQTTTLATKAIAGTKTLTVSGSELCNDLYIHTESAGSLLRKGDLKAGRQMMSKAYALVPKCLRQGHPDFLKILLESLAVLACRKSYALIAMFQEYVNQMAKIVLPGLHPWRQILDLIIRSNIVVQNDILLPALRCCTESQEQVLGQNSHPSVASRLDYLYIKSHIDTSSDPTPQFRDFIARYNLHLGPYHFQTVHAMQVLAVAYFRRHEYQKCLTLLHDVIECARISQLTAWESVALSWSARCWHSLDDNVRAEETMRYAIRLRASASGCTDPRTIRSMTTLREWLRDWGRHEEAELLDAEITASVAAIDVELDDDVHILERY